MHFISSFQHSAFLELVLSDLEQNGISKENLFVTPLEKNSFNLPDLKKVYTKGPASMN